MKVIKIAELVTQVNLSQYIFQRSVVSNRNLHSITSSHNYCRAQLNAILLNCTLANDLERPLKSFQLKKISVAYFSSLW